MNHKILNFDEYLNENNTKYSDTNFSDSVTKYVDSMIFKDVALKLIKDINNNSSDNVDIIDRNILNQTTITVDVDSKDLLYKLKNALFNTFGIKSDIKTQNGVYYTLSVNSDIIMSTKQ